MQDDNSSGNGDTSDNGGNEDNLPRPKPDTVEKDGDSGKKKNGIRRPRPEITDFTEESGSKSEKKKKTTN